MFLVFLGAHLLRPGDFLRPHWVGEYLLGFFTNILIEGHGPCDLVLPLLDEVHIVSRLTFPVKSLPLESGHVLELQTDLSDRVLRDFVEVWQALQELDLLIVLAFLDGSQGIHEIFFSYNGEMAVFFASNGGVSRFFFNERNLTKIITIFKDIDLRVFMFNPVLAVGLIKRYDERYVFLHQPDSS
jgi:hypothetical protein